MFPTTVGVARYHFFGAQAMIGALRGFELHYFGPDSPKVDTRPYIILAGTVKFFYGDTIDRQLKSRDNRPKPNSVWGKPGEGGKWGGYAVLKMIAPSVWTTHCGRYPAATCATISIAHAVKHWHANQVPVSYCLSHLPRCLYRTREGRGGGP